MIMDFHPLSAGYWIRLYQKMKIKVSYKIDEEDGWADLRLSYQLQDGTYYDNTETRANDIG